MSPRQRLITLAAVLAAIVVVPVTWSVVQRVAYAPDEPVADLVAAFNAGDLARAAELAGCRSRLCQPGALREGYQPPTDLSVADVSVAGGSGSVRVRYRLAGARHETPVLVERDAGWGMRGWRIVGGATGYVDVVSTASKRARLAGGTVDTLPAARSGGRRDGANEVLLGVYAVTADNEDPLFTAAPATVTVTGESRGGRVASVALDMTVKPAVVDEVNRQVRAYLDDCARVAEFRPRGCPFAYNKVIYRPAAPTWRIDDPPGVEVRAADRVTASGAPLTVRTRAPGHATIEYTSDGVPQTATVEFTVQGSVSADGSGKITWTP
jgi:hypothetical protein